MTTPLTSYGGHNFAPPPAAGSTSAADPWGLGQWATAKVDASNLLGPVRAQQGQQATTAADVVAAFAHADPATVARIQQYLLAAGFYSSTYIPKPGVVTNDDVRAFANAVQSAAKQNPNSTQPVDLNDYVARAAQIGQVQGSIAVAAKASAVLQRQDPNSIAQTIRQTFQSLLGRDPTPAEISALSATYTAQLTKYQEAAAGLSTPEGKATAQTGIDPSLAETGLATEQGQITRPLGGPGQAGRDTETETTGPSGRNYATVDDELNALQAAGKLVVSTANWSAWAREAGLGPGAQQTPGNEQYVARFKLSQYYRTFGSWQAATVAWLGGPGAGARFANNPSDPRSADLAEQASQISSTLPATGTPFLYGSPIQPQPNVTQLPYQPDLGADAEAYVRQNYGQELGQNEGLGFYREALRFVGSAAGGL